MTELDIPVSRSWATTASISVRPEIKPALHPSEPMTLLSPRPLALLIVLRHLYDDSSWIGQR